MAIVDREELFLFASSREVGIRRVLEEQVHRGTRFEAVIGRAIAAAAGRSAAADALSDRERDVFRHLQTAQSLAEIATSLGLSVNTVKTHQRSIYRKLGVSSRREAVRSVL
nr:helix-turn-helix transcriptional regulator [Microbacterium excoecariae]